MKRFAFALLMAGVTMALPRLEAKSAGCTVADFNGSFGVLVTGTVVPGLPISGPFARMGKLVADGKGNLTAKTTASYAGAVLRENFEGQYQVSDDCQVSFNVTLPQPVNLPVRFEGFIVDDGKEVFVMVVDPPGAAISGILKRQ